MSDGRWRVARALQFLALSVGLGCFGYQWVEGKDWENRVFASPTSPDASTSRTVPFPYKGTTYYVSRASLDAHSRTAWVTWTGFLGGGLLSAMLRRRAPGGLPRSPVG